MMIDTLLRHLRTSADFLYGPSLLDNNLLSYLFAGSCIPHSLWSHVLTICHLLFFPYFRLLWKFGICYSTLWSDGQALPVNLRLHWCLQKSLFSFELLYNNKGREWFQWKQPFLILKILFLVLILSTGVLLT